LSLRSKFEKELRDALFTVGRSGTMKHLYYIEKEQTFHAILGRALGKRKPSGWIAVGLVRKEGDKAVYIFSGLEGYKAVRRLFDELELGVSVDPGLLGPEGAKKLLDGGGQD